MHKKLARKLSGILAGALCLTTVFTNSAFVYADDANESAFETVLLADKGTYAITGITDGAIQDDGMFKTVTIPDEIDGKKVTKLGIGDNDPVPESEKDSHKQAYSFLGRQNNGDAREVTNLVLGRNLNGLSPYAFFGAKYLEKIDVSNRKDIFHFDDKILYTSSMLIKYLSTAEKRDYTVPDGLLRILNMDYTEFGTLNLNDVTAVYKGTFAGSLIDTLIVGDTTVIIDENTTDNSNAKYDILYGAIVNEFESTGSTYQTVANGKMLVHNGRLIKIANGTGFEKGDFDNFTSISPYAFNSIEEYKRLMNIIPDRLTKNVVFSFFSQNDAVFMVNNEISFCYNFDKRVPTEVGDITDYSANIDEEKYEKIKALMYVGVPFDGTGLFKEIFGKDYDDILDDTDVMLYGNAALNAVSRVVYETLDQGYPAEIKGIGHGPFDHENVMEYISRLREVVSRDNYKKYNFIPKFALEDSIISFHSNDGKYVSDPIQVNTLDGSNTIDNSYVYDIYIQTSGITVQNGDTSFKTGESIVLVADNKPSEINFAYKEPSLKYYKQTTKDVQNVLVSATKQSSLTLNATISVDNLIISKLDFATEKELPGAQLELSFNGNVIDSWTSGMEPHLIPGSELSDGTYTLTETTAPNGYEIAESITFEIKDGKVEGGRVVMYDKPVEKQFVISKVDAANSEELPGASLVIKNEKEEIVKEWVSSDTPYIVSGLEDGKYTLTEITAPNGYEIAESIEFEVTGGKVEDNQITMEDKRSENGIEISKVDATTSEELPGASLVIKDATGEVVEEWESTNEPHIVTDLKDGKYTLTETTAPNGYEIAESIEFEVINGKVEGNKIVMEDKPSENTVLISKVDATNSKELPGASLTVKDVDGNVVDEWISGTTPHAIVGLSDGKYTLTEVTAPTGYEVAESIEFEVIGGKVTGGKITMEDKRKEATPSDATPSEPDDDDDNVPDVPIYPDEPVEPSKPSHSGGHSSGGGGGSSHSSSSSSDSSSESGVTKVAETIPETEPAQEPQIETEQPITPVTTNETAPLPVTGDYTAAWIIFIASLFTMFCIYEKRKKIVK